MNFDFSKSHEEDREKYKEFALNFISPYVRSMDIEERTPAHVINKMCEHGLFGISIDKQFGGSGKDFLSATLCMEELSKVSPAVAGIINVTTELVAGSINKFGTAQQKAKYLPKLASGEAIGAFCITESGAGSDTAGAKTTAVLKDDHYIINGTKTFITNAEISSIFLIGAMTDLSDGKRKMSIFIVEKDFPGFIVGKAEHKMGIRASSTCELIMEDCIVPKENLLGDLGKGQRIALESLDGGRVMIAAQALGIAQGAIDETVRYLKENADYTEYLINRQGIQFKLVDIQTKTNASRLMVYQAAVLWDQGKSFTMEAAMAKLYASEVANEVARDCVQIMGYEGCGTDYLVESMMRDAKITEIYEGTNEIQRLVISGLLGLKA